MAIRIPVQFDLTAARSQAQALANEMDQKMTRAEWVSKNIRSLMAVSMSLVSATMSATMAMMGSLSNVIPAIVSSAIGSTVSTIGSIVASYYALAAATQNPGFLAYASGALAVMGSFIATTSTIAVFTSREMGDLISGAKTDMNRGIGVR